MKVDLHKQDGKKVTTGVQVSDSVFGTAWKPDLVHQVVVAMQANRRFGIAHTKDRSEVRGGGKKPWRQKGTGRARHGSSRSPIWRGGGVTFGPRNDKDYSQKINRKMRIRSLVSLLSAKFKNNQIFFIDKVEIKEAKTKNIQNILNNMQKISGLETINTRKNKNNVLFILPELSEDIKLAFSNIPHASLETADNLSTLQLAKVRYVLIVEPLKSSDVFEKRLGNMDKKVKEEKVTVAKKEKTKTTESDKTVVEKKKITKKAK